MRPGIHTLAAADTVFSELSCSRLTPHQVETSAMQCWKVERSCAPVIVLLKRTFACRPWNNDKDVRPWPWPGLKVGNFGLGLGGPGLGTQALALQRYKAKAKAKADISEPQCHSAFLGNIHILITLHWFSWYWYLLDPTITNFCVFPSAHIMCPNRARMSDSMSESLVFLHCYCHLWLCA